MKLTALILLIACLQVSAKSNAQDKISLSVKNVPLEKVFKDIEKQSGYIVWCEKNLLEKATKVTLQLSNASLIQALSDCLKNQPLWFTIVGKTIVISLKENAFPKIEDREVSFYLKDIDGQVTDSLGTPLIGATITIKGKEKRMTTDDNGQFSLKGIDNNDVLVISYIGYHTQEVQIGQQKSFSISLRRISNVLANVEVVYSTGYQKVPKERTTGSFGLVNTELVNRKVSTNVLDRLDGVATGLSFTGTPAKSLTFDPQSRTLGITVRGVSTLSPTLVGNDPLIVLDNFPYDGDLANINPNDIESVSILKDAAAASIWGARAGNGVIVLTTKKGRYKNALKLEINSSVTIGNKPNLFNDLSYLNSNDFINVEDTLFQHGYFNSDISNTSSRPAISPVVSILNRQRRGLISATDANSQIDALRGIDVRNDFSKYFLQKLLNQQYSIAMRGGTNNMSYSFSAGYDKNKDNAVRNSSNRLTLSATNFYTPIKNLEINTAVYFTNNELTLDNAGGYPGASVNGKYGGVYPYAKLADAQGNALATSTGYNTGYLDSVQRLGFLDWQYKPLDELKNRDNTIKTKDFLIRVGAKYKFTSWLNLEVQYQNESQTINNRLYQNQQTYFARNLINKFSIYDPITHNMTYQIPLGGVLNMTNTEWNSYNWRSLLNVSKKIASNQNISGLAGAEIRQFKSKGYSLLSYGYDDQYGTAINNLDYIDYLPTNPGGYSQIPAPDQSFSGVTNRYISYFGNVAYTLKERYTLSLSGRKDGANLFGVKTNDKITPLWSIGGSWHISNEQFYKIDWVPSLKLRATYGYNGNVYNGSAYVTGQYAIFNPTGAQTIYSLTPPNPELRWEKVKNINVGIDFSSRNNFVTGTIDIYQKEGLDLIEPIQLPASVGFTSFYGNAAATRTRGIELALTTKIIESQFKWSVTLLGNYLKDQVRKYDAAVTASSLLSNGLIVPVKGKPLFSLFSYKWAGLDPVNGDPQGYLNKNVSKDYSNIINNYKPDSLVFSGSARPTIWGSLRNDFYYKGFTLSVMITYKMGYYFRRPSVSPNYTDAISNQANIDYSTRWQKPGDEKITNVPSFVYPANTNRSKFYQYSEILMQKGDHIRLQDIRLAYDIRKAWKNTPSTNFQVFCYASNLGILWRANKFNIDPDHYSYGAFHSYSTPFAIAFGFQASF